MLNTQQEDIINLRNLVAEIFTDYDYVIPSALHCLIQNQYRSAHTVFVS